MLDATNSEGKNTLAGNDTIQSANDGNAVILSKVTLDQIANTNHEQLTWQETNIVDNCPRDCAFACENNQPA